MNILDLSEQEIVRRNSLAQLREMGIDPYPADEFVVDAYSDDIREQFRDDAEPRSVRVAGRIMSRTQARKGLSMDEFKAEMSGIWSSTVTKGTLDEAPMAYKTMDDIVANIGPTADIVNVIKPIYNFKAVD